MRVSGAKKAERGRSSAPREPFPDFPDEIYFLAPALQQSLQLIRYLLQSSRQLILITGESGSGVSALCRYLASRTDRPWGVRLIATIPSSDPGEILAGILNERPSEDQLDDRLVRNLRQMEEQGLQPLVIVDNAELLLGPQLRLLIKYPMRMALNPFIADIGNLLPSVISGSAIVAVVLSLQTSGPMLLEALRSQDQYLAGSFLMFLSLLTVIGMFISDLLLAALDPRIRLTGGAAK